MPRVYVLPAETTRLGYRLGEYRRVFPAVRHPHPQRPGLDLHGEVGTFAQRIAVDLDFLRRHGLDLGGLALEILERGVFPLAPPEQFGGDAEPAQFAARCHGHDVQQAIVEAGAGEDLQPAHDLAAVPAHHTADPAVDGLAAINADPGPGRFAR